MVDIKIIGASGFIGTNLLDLLQKGDYRLTNIDKSASIKHPSITKIADVRDYEQLTHTITPSEWVVILAAEHRDDVSPSSLYYDVNVTGMQNILKALDDKDIKKIIFTSTVAIYGLNKENPSENSTANPFNHYGKSKWEAEEMLREWHSKDSINRTLIIIRPTVVFGPGNKGNVYNLLQQISSGKFMMIGNGENKKSMAFISNIVGFIKYCIDQNFNGYQVFNYADKPDLTTNELVLQAEKSLKRKVLPIKIPYLLGYSGGLIFDLIAKIIGKNLPVSSIRVKKFCSTTQFSSDKMLSTGYTPPYSLNEGLDITINSITDKTL
jgi:nucleoside-diphosphate-sugar epimerase